MKMNVHFSLFLSLFLLFHKANAFNITNLLTKYPDFSDFNRYLTQTNLAGEINSRQTITVLVVENGNLSPVSSKPPNVLKNILSVHVILDYYDVQKLQRLTNKTATLTTLFQTSGLARGQQGFINITHLSTSSIAFGSAVPGAAPGSNLVKSVASQPYNLSVLQVSNIIIPQGLDGSSSPAPSTAPSQAPSVSPVPSMSPRMPPQVSPPVPPPSPSQGPAPSDPPSNAQTPAEAVTPAATPSSAPAADAPTADAPTADAPAPAAPAADQSPNACSGLHSGLDIVFAVVLSTLFLVTKN